MLYILDEYYLDNTHQSDCNIPCQWQLKPTKLISNKTALYSKADHPQKCAFSYVCSLLVTWRRWRTHHPVCQSRKPHATCKLHGSVFDRTGVTDKQRLRE